MSGQSGACTACALNRHPVYFLIKDKWRKKLHILKKSYLKYKQWYPQTWMYVNRIKGTVIGWLLQSLCKKITGHQASKTEKDYAGNGMVGQWCRWCNCFWEVPLEETPSAEYLKDIFEGE
jgi:hypothetical protein